MGRACPSHEPADGSLGPHRQLSDLQHAAAAGREPAALAPQPPPAAEEGGLEEALAAAAAVLAWLPDIGTADGGGGAGAAAGLGPLVGRLLELDGRGPREEGGADATAEEMLAVEELAARMHALLEATEELRSQVAAAVDAVSWPVV